MNGRIFDRTLGVFLQGDPFIQDPENLQNYNGYGYCYDNPLTARLAKNKYGHMAGLIAIAIVSSIFCEEGAYICDAIGEAAWAAIAGYSATQSLEIGVISGAMAYANMELGDYLPGAGTSRQRRLWCDGIDHRMEHCRACSHSGHRGHRFEGCRRQR